MSHSHSHAPGESHSHSHSPPPPPDPAIIALIEQDYKPVNIKLGDPNNANAYCSKHSLEKCDECAVDFRDLNNLAKLFVHNPQLICPPPPQVVQAQRAQAVNKTKEDGNVLFKAHKHKEAISMYTMAANVAAQRLAWEPNGLMKEELATVLSNRSAAYAAAGDNISALVDADIVIQVKRPWSKGHFRKAKALTALGQLEEAKEAISLGLAYEPQNAEMSNFLVEINNKIEKSRKQ